MGRIVQCLIALLALSLCAPLAAQAHDGEACMRAAAGGVVKAPSDLRSHNGVLNAYENSANVKL